MAAAPSLFRTLTHSSQPRPVARSTASELMPPGLEFADLGLVALRRVVITGMEQLQKDRDVVSGRGRPFAPPRRGATTIPRSAPRPRASGARDGPRASRR